MMALERVPADIRRDGGVARMADPKVNNPELAVIITILNLCTNILKLNNN